MGESIALYTLPLGSHTLTITVSDLAGNQGSQTVTFETYASFDGLQQLVAHFASIGWIDNIGIANSLQKKLDSNNLLPFINEVKAQSGKHISAKAAEYLLRDANALLK